MYKKIDAYIDRLIEDSSPDAPVWNIESIRQGKKPHWNYIDGCMITALIEIAAIMGFTYFMYSAGIEQNTFGGGSFTSIDVSHDADVSSFLKRKLSAHFLILLKQTESGHYQR